MKLWKIVLFAVAVLVTSCSIQKKPKLQITHVLAVTQQGDTLTIPIDVIRPINYRIINYNNSSWSRPYYYPYYNYNYNNYSYSNSSTSRGSTNKTNNNNNNNTKWVPRDNPDKRPSGEVLLKGKN